MKDEYPNTPIKKFIGLRSKLYCVDVGFSIPKSKGIPKCVSRKRKFTDYEQVLTSKKPKCEEFYRISSKKHCLSTEFIKKIGLSVFDDKRLIGDDGVCSVPYV